MNYKILLNEPYYRDSHKYWADNLVKYSQHEITLLTLPGRHWKWRMQGSAIHFAKMYNKLEDKPDLIICSTMMDVSFYKSLLKQKTNIPQIIYYLHENQLAYPFSGKEKRKQEDFHYGFINYKSCLTADFVLFNSAFNKNTFLSELKKLLNRLPDYTYSESCLAAIEDKSSISYVGIDFNKIRTCLSKASDELTNPSPTLLWNHRWEEDKQPHLFLELCNFLASCKIEFNLILLNNTETDKTGVFKKLQNNFKDKILISGYQKDYNDYIYWLSKADIIPITSNHEFYGISAMEAIYCGAYPIMPDHLVYKEIYHQKAFEDCFYSSQPELHLKVVAQMKERKENIHNKKNILDKHDIYKLIKVIDLHITEKASMS